MLLDSHPHAVPTQFGRETFSEKLIYTTVDPMAFYKRNINLCARGCVRMNARAGLFVYHAASRPVQPFILLLGSRVRVNSNSRFRSSNLPGRTKTTLGARGWMRRRCGRDNNKRWQVEEGKKIPLSLWHRNLIVWRISSIMLEGA